MKRMSHSELEVYQRCQQKYKYRYIHGYRPRTMGAKVEIGSWVHNLLEAYYRAVRAGKQRPLVAVEKAHKQLLKEKWNVLFEEEQEILNKDVPGDLSLPETARQITLRYIQRYQAEDRAQWRKILLVEQEITVKADWLARPFVFLCDLVVLDKQGWVRVYDHKVITGDIPNEDSRLLDPQGARYVLAMSEFLKRKGIRVPGVIMVYDYIRGRLPAKPKLLKDGKALSRQWIDTEPDVYLAAIKEHGFDEEDYEDFLDRIRREGKPYFDRWAVPKSEARLAEEKKQMAYLSVVTKRKQEYYPRTLDRNRCPWDCEFRDICMVELEGGDIGPILRERFEVKRGA